jgi:glycogen operon protein
LYQVGQFVGDSWKEWNGRFRDDVRSFFSGAAGAVPRLADRLVGSPSIYAHKDREAEQSVNFVTCHDGFTLNDLVSYNQKHNEANGEENRDGSNDNRSWNCGAEGPTPDPAIEQLRNRQVKNFFTATLFALGMPMILMGDEIRRTQLGNNNAYCQDNEISWFDWTLTERHADVLRFARLLIERRLLRDTDAELSRLSLNELIRGAPHAWHGVQLYQPDWSEQSHSLAFSTEVPREKLAFFWILNAYWAPLHFALPPARDKQATRWRRWIDTYLDSPHDIVPWDEAPSISDADYLVGPRSVVVLVMNLA